MSQGPHDSDDTPTDLSALGATNGLAGDLNAPVEKGLSAPGGVDESASEVGTAQAVTTRSSAAEDLRVVTGKNLVPMDSVSFNQLVGHYRPVHLDVGTGDAKTAYRHALSHPDTLVIGVDPAWQQASAVAAKALKKPAKGGAPNLLLVAASITKSPTLLANLADSMTVLMPWGELLRGIVLAQPAICAGLRAVARAGCEVRITIDTSIWRDPVPTAIRDLPELTGEHADRIRGEWSKHGWQLTEFHEHHIDPSSRSGDLDAVARSSWARRLRSDKSALVVEMQWKAM